MNSQRWETPTMIKKQRSMKQVMYAVFCRSTGLVNASKLDGQKTVIAKWYVEKYCVKGSMEFQIRELCSTMIINRPIRQFQLSSFSTEENIKVIDQPYSPDLDMCNFRLFFGLMRYLRGRIFLSAEEINIAVHAYSEGIPKEDWLGAFKLRKGRMVTCIITEGNYFEHI